MELQDFINHNRPLLEKCVKKRIDETIEESLFDEEKRALKKVKNCMCEGKMLRGLMVMMSAQLHGLKINDEVLTVASVIELLHTALLIQDDIMDNDFQRRGKDAIFYQYLKEGKEKNVNEPLLYGQSMGICISDICFFMGMKSIASVVKNPTMCNAMMQMISKEIQSVAAAQMIDQVHGLTSLEPDSEEIMLKYLYKTAHYSFSLPVSIGALFKTDENIPLLRQFGEHMGIIFQLKDDELGIFGNEAAIGKHVGSDIQENKKTLLRFYLFQHAASEDKAKLLSIFGKKPISEENLHFVQDCMKKYDCLTKIEKDIQERIGIIKSILESLEKNGLETKLLQKLVEYNLGRKK